MNFIFHETSIIGCFQWPQQFFLVVLAQLHVFKRKILKKLVVSNTQHFIFKSKPSFQKTISVQIYKLCLYLNLILKKQFYLTTICVKYVFEMDDFSTNL